MLWFRRATLSLHQYTKITVNIWKMGPMKTTSGQCMVTGSVLGPMPDGRHIDDHYAVLNQAQKRPDSCRHYCFLAWNAANWSCNGAGSTVPCILPFYVADGVLFSAVSALRSRWPAVQHCQLLLLGERGWRSSEVGDFAGSVATRICKLSNHMINHGPSARCEIVRCRSCDDYQRKT